MDPTTNLDEQRRIVRRLKKAEDAEHLGCLDCITDIARLGELVQALDEWISKGGFLPAQWQRKGG